VCIGADSTVPRARQRLRALLAEAAARRDRLEEQLGMATEFIGQLDHELG